MLVIRLQRTGRKGHAMFRIVVQDSRRTPSSGKLVAHLGHYDPHTKTVKIDKEKATTFLNNGAQPSNRMIGILKSESVKLPKWVNEASAKKRDVKNPEKRRSTAPEPTEKPAEKAAEEVTAEAPTEEPAEDKVEAQPETQEPAEEAKDSKEAEVTEEPVSEPEQKEEQPEAAVANEKEDSEEKQ